MKAIERCTIIQLAPMDAGAQSSWPSATCTCSVFHSSRNEVAKAEQWPKIPRSTLSIPRIDFGLFILVHLWNWLWLHVSQAILRRHLPTTLRSINAPCAMIGRCVHILLDPTFLKWGLAARLELYSLSVSAVLQYWQRGPPLFHARVLQLCMLVCIILYYTVLQNMKLIYNAEHMVQLYMPHAEQMCHACTNNCKLNDSNIII